jgi:hypothetical protein
MLRRGMAMILFPATCKCSSPAARMQASPRVTFRNRPSSFVSLSHCINSLTVNAKCLYHFFFIFTDVRLYYHQESVVVIVHQKVQGGQLLVITDFGTVSRNLYESHIFPRLISSILYSRIIFPPGRHHVRHLRLPSVCFQSLSIKV